MVRRTLLAVVAVALLPLGALLGAPPASAAGLTDGRLVGYQSRDNYVLMTPAGARSELPLVNVEPYYSDGNQTARAGWHPNGDRFAYLVGDPVANADRIMELHADGSRTQLGGDLPDRYTYSVASAPDYGGDGSYVLAEVSHQVGRGSERELWRFEGTAAPVLVTSGPMAGWDVRPGSDTVAVADAVLTGEAPRVRLVDARTGASTPVTLPLGADQYLSGLAWAPDGRLLLLHAGAGGTRQLSWWTPGAPAVTPLQQLADPGGSIITASLSPSGRQIFLDDNEGGQVMPTTGGTPVHLPTGTDVFLDESPWQPCPDGVCPAFRTLLSPPTSPRMRTSVAGTAGGASTAKARWRAPLSTGGRPVTAYKVQAQRVSASGAVLSRVTVRRPADARRYVFSVPRGRYAFRARALNAKGASPWSKVTAPVRAR